MNALEVLTIGVSVLGWCLVHFVWQAAVIGVMYAVARLLLPRGNPRYLAAMLALLAMAIWPVATAWHELATMATPVNLGDVVVTGTAVVTATHAVPSTWQTLLDVALPWLVLAWVAGVAVLGVRVLRQWRGLKAMLRAAERLPAWQARAHQFAARLGLQRMVPVLASVRVATPTLVGWVRPAVVLPLAVLARMPAAQIDLILAHELAHLKRFDHIANLFQVVLETLFFYHPVVHWISREARNERELCCDALALEATGGERRDFVAALASLEEFRAGDAGLALAASGGVLVERAWFIVGGAAEPRGSRRRARGHVFLLLAAVAVLALGWTWWQNHAWQQRAEAQVSAGNASLLQFVRQNAVQAVTPLAMGAVAVMPRLLPVSPVEPEPALDAELVPVSMTPIATTRPTLAVPNLVSRIAALAPVAATPVMASASVGLRPVHTARPVYPSAELLAGVEGRVVVAFTLDARGVPRDLEVLGSGSAAFGTAALQALARWRFAPPSVPGRRYRQAFTFQINVAPGDDAATARPCLITTGTHICRHVFDAAADVTRLSPPRP